MRQNFSVQPVLRKDKRKANGTFPVIFQVIINSEPIKLPSGSFVKLDEWDQANNRAKGTEGRLLNIKLNQQVSELQKFLLTEVAQGRRISKESLRAFYYNTDVQDFYTYIQEFYRLKFLDLTSGTRYHYELLERRLKKFKSKIRFDNINLSFVEEFDFYLRINLGIGDDGRATMHKKLRAILLKAFRNKLIDQYPYHDFKIPKGKINNSSLSESDVKLIEDLKFDDSFRGKGLELTRDLFLFACYTGLRYSDTIASKRSSILANKTFTLIMVKTKTPVTVPIFNKAEKLIEKYFSESDKVFPYRSNQCCNADLKEIQSVLKIPLKMSFHLGRHTFGTILAKNGVNMFDLMRMMGHTSLEQTKTYVTSDFVQVKENLAEVEFFN